MNGTKRAMSSVKGINGDCTEYWIIGVLLHVIGVINNSHLVMICSQSPLTGGVVNLKTMLRQY